MMKAINLYSLTKEGRNFAEKVVKDLPDENDPNYEIVLLRRIADYLEEQKNK